ncbi:hypothetical protein BC828DRAFT_222349 [Blastocladiella britannica]|nr:hypothetical protein BC828DRAFT_222349 [Blastocladiella britannica]
MLYLTRLAPALGRRKVLRRIVYLLVVSAVWAAILTPTYLVYRGEISDSNVLPSSPIPNFSQYINVSARISNIDTLKGSYHLTLDLLAVFDGPANANSLPLFTRANGERRANLPITLTIQDTTKAIRVGERLGSIDATITFDESDTRDYPFDQHLSNVDLIAQTTFNNVTRSVPMRISVNGAVPGFALPQFGVFADQSQDFGSLLLTLTIGRSGTTKGFALFIVALSWFLSLIMGYLALQVARKKRAVEPPMMAPPCALLFALPSLRNVQPGVPGIGASVDVLGFFWCACKQISLS